MAGSSTSVTSPPCRAPPAAPGLVDQVDRKASEDVRVVAVKRLAPWVGPGRVERPLGDRVEGAGRRDHRTADGEAPLFLNDEGQPLPLHGDLRGA